MSIKNWAGKIEETEILNESIDEDYSIHSAQIPESFSHTEENKADKVDCLVAASSGVITAAMDILWVGEFSLIDAQNIGTDYINRFVVSFARSKGCSKNELKECIRFLEQKYPLASDKLTSEFGGGLQHHLRDFSHHASPFGLICSILNQFTLKGYGTDTDGHFISPDLPQSDAVGVKINEKIWWGVVDWAFHLISDMAGSSGGKGSGTGIPGPILSLVKELSAIPLFTELNIKYKDDEQGLSIWISKLFNGTAFNHTSNADLVKFDLRTELGIGVFATKQFIPVFINQCITRTFYFIRRFAEEYSERRLTDIHDLKTMNAKKMMPFHNRSIDRMITIATGTFTIIDGMDAVIRSKIQNSNSKSEILITTLLRLNFVGIGAFTISIKKEVEYLIDDAKNFFNKETNAAKLLDGEVAEMMGSSVDIEVLMDNRDIYKYSFTCMLNNINNCYTNYALAQEQMLSVQKAVLNVVDENGALFNSVAKRSRHSMLVETEKLIMRLFKHNNVSFIPFDGNEIYSYLPFYRVEDGMKIAYIFNTSITGKVKNWESLKTKYNLDGIKVVALVDLQEDEELLKTLITFEEKKTNEFVKYITLNDLFDLIGKGEYSIYLEYAHKFNLEIRELIGYSTITIPSKDMMRNFKEKEIVRIEKFDYRQYLKELRDSQIDIILKSYLNDKRYQIIIGDSNLAESFLSSEWYYSMHDSTIGIEQTAIIAGYLKSVEQLLYELIKLSINTGKDIKKKNSKEYIPYTTENEHNVDYTLGSMIGYVKHYQELWQVNNYARFFVGDILTKFRIKYRNDHFHKDNVYQISEIEEIREQTLLLFALLLGAFKLSDSSIKKFLPYHKDKKIVQSLTYNDIEKWLDLILGGDNLLDSKKPIYFMMMGYGIDRWKLDFCTVKGFDKKNFPLELEYPYINNPIMWPNILEKNEAESKMVSFIHQYLEDGKYGIKLKKHQFVFAGFFAHPQPIYKK